MIKTPLNLGILQSDIDFANRKPLSADLSAYAGDNLTWNLATKQFDAEASGGAVSSAPSAPLPSTATATDLLSSVAGTRTPIPALAPNQGNWFDSQTYDPCVIVNPSDSTQLIMFFSGMGAPVQLGEQKIGRATASIIDPTTWTVSNSGNPVLNATLPWETGGDGLRADSIAYNAIDGKLYLFYTAKAASVGVASSSDLGLTWTKLGQALTPTADETNVSQMAVLVDGTTVHALYAYRTAGATLPGYRYASASTSNWLTWTKQPGDVFVDTNPPLPRMMEFHHLFKVGSTYVIAYECGGTSIDWDIRFATSSNPASGWVISPITPFFVKSGVPGAFDRYMPATPHVMVINGYWYMFYCGAMDHDIPYGTNHFQMGFVPLLVPFQVPQLYIGTDLRIMAIAGGGKLQARNPATDTWADKDSWTNP